MATGKWVSPDVLNMGAVIAQYPHDEETGSTYTVTGIKYATRSVNPQVLNSDEYGFYALTLTRPDGSTMTIEVYGGHSVWMVRNGAIKYHHAPTSTWFTVTDVLADFFTGELYHSGIWFAQWCAEWPKCEVPGTVGFVIDHGEFLSESEALAWIYSFDCWCD